MFFLDDACAAHAIRDPWMVMRESLPRENGEATMNLRLTPLLAKTRLWWRSLLPTSVLALALIAATVAISGQSPTKQTTAGQSTADQSSRQGAPTQSLSAAEFSRLVRELSEEGGFFRSDNFTSNETSYLHVTDK